MLIWMPTEPSPPVVSISAKRASRSEPSRREGLSLVKGVQMPLKAIALSIKPGAEADHIEIGGKLATSGENVITLEIGGTLSALFVTGGIHATGHGSDAVHAMAGAPDLGGIEITAAHGK
ncbi:hypothetical protein [Saccharopolyspora pogona]|uniref:hypothetical protein n=1 Tax=Saccharopolyspora pogona TaxID=333966 RepID=UPI0016872FB6|nr:hypothetical protein [Saccharopolyspora pogona]